MGVASVVALALACGASGASVPAVSGLAVCSCRGSLVVSSLTGGDKRPLTKPRGRHEHRVEYNPTWSPDGSMVAFGRWAPKQVTLMVVRSDGTGLRQVAALGRWRHSYSAGVLDIRWSPDGTKLAYLAVLPTGHGTPEAIYVAAVDGSAWRRIALIPKTPDGAFFSLFGWTPDGTRVTYAVSGGEPISLHYDGPSDLFTTSTDGTDSAKLLTEDEIDDASWLADGSLLYVRNCLLPSACQLASREPGSATSRALTHFKFPAWIGCCEWDGLPFMQTRSGDIVFTHARKVYDFSPTANSTRTVHVFRCPRKRCQPLDDFVDLAGISRDGRVALIRYENSSSTIRPYHRDYRLDLETGALTHTHLVTTNPAQIYLP